MSSSHFISIPGLVDRYEVLHADGHVDEHVAPNGSFVTFYGWLFGSGVKLVAIWVAIAGKFVAAQVGYHRPDVSAHLGTTEASQCGFRATTLLDGLEPGQYELSVEGVDEEGRLYRSTGDSQKLVVAKSAAPPRARARIDEILVDELEFSDDSVSQIHADSAVVLRGWALSSDLRPGLDLVLGIADDVKIEYGLERPDLVSAFGEPARFGGFTGSLSGQALLASRENRLTFALLAADGAGLLATDASIELSVNEHHLIVRQ